MSLEKAFRGVQRAYEDLVDGDATEADYTAKLQKLVDVLKTDKSFDEFRVDDVSMVAAKNPEFSRFALDTMGALIDAGLNVTENHIKGAVDANNPEFLDLLLKKSEGLSEQFARVGYVRGTVLQMATSHKYVPVEAYRTDEGYLQRAGDVAAIVIAASMEKNPEATLKSLEAMKDKAGMLPTIRAKVLEALDVHAPQGGARPEL